MIQEFKGNLHEESNLITNGTRMIFTITELLVKDYEKMIRERDDMIECLAKCRALDEEYEGIFLASQQLDQNVLRQSILFNQIFSPSCLIWKRKRRNRKQKWKNSCWSCKTLKMLLMSLHLVLKALNQDFLP